MPDVRAPVPPPAQGGALKRRSKRSLTARLATYWVVVALLLVALAGAALWFVNAPYFQMNSLAIVGTVRVSPSEVRASGALDPHANVWLVDTGAVARRIETIPYVGAAWVHRTFPASVKIVVAERTPTACLRDGAQRVFTLDDSLRVLERGCTLPSGPFYIVRASLAVVPGAFLRDPELLRLQSDDQTLAAAGKHYRVLRTDVYGGLVASLGDGIVVHFGNDDDLAREQGLISPILATLGPKIADVASLDLRAPTTPVVRYRVPASPKKRLR